MEPADARAKAMNTEIEQALREVPPQDLCEVMDSGEVPPDQEAQARMNKTFGVDQGPEPAPSRDEMLYMKKIHEQCEREA